MGKGYKRRNDRSKIGRKEGKKEGRKIRRNEDRKEVQIVGGKDIEEDRKD